MERGLVFDINEFAVYDGPGIRTTVFLKGCPLRCRWCHNPEGLGFEQQLLAGTNGCLHCGRCEAVCPSPEHCTLCGACIKVCPRNLRRYAAKEYTSDELASRLNKNRDVLLQKGGVTFSGGEPLGRPAFLFEVIEKIKPIHVAIETSGYAEASVFDRMLTLVDMVLLDFKCMDPVKHKEFTGVSNEPIFRNFESLQKSGKPFEIRIPVIPGVNDTVENMEAAAQRIKGSPGLVRVELLRYHKTAGAKYELLGMEYKFSYTKETENFDQLIKPFTNNGIDVFAP